MGNTNSRSWLRTGAIVGLSCAFAVAALFLNGGPPPPASQASTYAGSASCRECHERFYELWSTSHHGLAMQPMSRELAGGALAPQPEAIEVGGYSYRADLASSPTAVRERGPDGEKSYPIAHVMGGKNVYYFLTELDRGMLQVLPVAYDVRKGVWFDTAASGMRHAGGHPDRPVDWRDRLYTFNTSCYACHVSQLSTHYDPRTDSYRTTWAEPGINCETCHGPSGEHVRRFRDAPPGHTPEALAVISTKTMTTAQRNDLCAPCHAKMQPVTASFVPGERFFDHYGLLTLEDVDFYPDGRDLGENYTYTSWMMSPCARSGRIDCMHCHTSSGRYRFKEAAKANDACLPCHDKQVANAAEHSHHDAGTEGSTCISCHMPKTEFARMIRSDHSMRPPVPSATMAFGSPNACNLCHADKDPAWSDKYVREWRSRDYQAPVLEAARLVDAARKQDWSRLPDMLARISRADRDEIVAASLLRLLIRCADADKWPVVVKALRDPSPLVRAAAAESLEGYLTGDSVAALLAATRDDYRLVRVRAAATLAALEPGDLPAEARAGLERATAEFLASLRARPDDYASHYNLGNYYAERGEPDKAIAAYGTALKLNPGFAAPLVNASLVFSRQGRNDEAEKALRKALAIDPHNAPAWFNLGLLLAELERPAEAEAALRDALKNDPHMAQAAYNLGVLLAGQGKTEGLDWCRKAWELRPADPRNGYTLACCQLQMNDAAGAAETLERMADGGTAHADAYALLGGIYERDGQRAKALATYRRAAENPNLDEDQRAAFATRAGEFANN